MAELDGKAVDPFAIPLRDDGETHSVTVTLGLPIAEPTAVLRGRQHQ